MLIRTHATGALYHGHHDSVSILPVALIGDPACYGADSAFNGEVGHE